MNLIIKPYPMSLKSIVMLLLAFGALLYSSKQAHATTDAVLATITITNPLPYDRTNEVVEIDNPCIQRPFLLTDSEGNEIPQQITYDNKLIFQASVTANGETIYHIIASSPSQYDTIACGFFIPERLDDLAWENDRTAYRAYGPALQRKGERAFGYDVWTKSTPYPVVLKRYHGNSHGISFHKDHGDGMDVYSVGPTLGAGTAALIDSTGDIVYPYCFTDYEILDCGPLRFTVKLTYDKETRIISLDAGSYFNKTTVIYNNTEGCDTVATGIVIHHNIPADRIATIHNEYAIAGYADPTDNPDAGNGIIYVGTITPHATLPYLHCRKEATHLLTKTKYYGSDTSFLYYWGAGWSKAGIASLNTWLDIELKQVEKISNPLSISISNTK
ncbi:MAG: DUF4861 domain-containing protein [Duncaniella sp.]|nr:DUF4861 domain-containing protein [Duncaniella sp.]